MSDPFVNNSVGMIVVLSANELNYISNLNSNLKLRLKNVFYGTRPQEYFGISMCFFSHFDIGYEKGF